MTTSTCRLFIERYARQVRKPFAYLDLLDEGKRLHNEFVYVTLKNNMMFLLRDGIIFKFPSENPARFMLKEYAKKDPRWKRLIPDDKNPTGGNGAKVFDFTKFVESLDWEELCYVHDVRVEFDVVKPVGVSTESGWRWLPRSLSWIKNFEFLEFPLTVQFYNTAHVQVSVKCSLKPIPFNFSGLTRLASALGELKGCLKWDVVCNVADWEVTSWHYGKDSKSEVSGPPFNATFLTWSRTLGRIYFKREISRVRVEEAQHPHQSIQSLFAQVIHDELSRGALPSGMATPNTVIFCNTSTKRNYEGE